MTICGMLIGYENEKEHKSILNFLNKRNYGYEDSPECNIVEIYQELNESEVQDIQKVIKSGRAASKKTNPLFDTILKNYANHLFNCSYLVELDGRIDDISVKSIVYSKEDDTCYAQITTSLFSQKEKVTLWLAQDKFTRMRLVADLNQNEEEYQMINE